MTKRRAKSLGVAAALVASRRMIAAVADLFNLMKLEIALEKELKPSANTARR